MTKSLSSIFPVFPVTDVDATIAWYNSILGFRAYPFPEKPPYVFAILERNGIEIAISKASADLVSQKRDNHPDEILDAYIRCSGVQEMYNELAEKVNVVSHLRKQPYGDIEFTIKDCNGYIIVFGGDVDKELT